MDTSLKPLKIYRTLTHTKEEEKHLQEQPNVHNGSSYEQLIGRLSNSKHLSKFTKNWLLRIILIDVKSTIYQSWMSERSSLRGTWTSQCRQVPEGGCSQIFNSPESTLSHL
ncbi:hypothetical protein QJS04_geneDACA020021 [Acorus gramineus]|uniref:Uncharacterized protein n=1 Tax=Acorus gramineus TaxID=55184 RepID=A0AAV9A559_ACOGR|nr:hypothetical protein QJS04_geneDACA020021 [Acorus gramineus]